MATAIRLSRMGRKNKAFYRIVVTDKRAKRTGKIIASLGYYDPEVSPVQIKVNKKELDTWISSGSQVSAAVGKLLKI